MDWRRTVAWFRSAHGGAADRVRHILSLSSVPCRHAAWQPAVGEHGSCEQVALEVGGKPLWGEAVGVGRLWRRKCAVRAPRTFWRWFQSVGEGGDCLMECCMTCWSSATHRRGALQLRPLWLCRKGGFALIHGYEPISGQPCARTGR